MSCKTCKYSEWETTNKGNVKRSLPGSCKYTVKIPVLPDSVINHPSNRYMPDTLFQKCAIWAERGHFANCACYEKYEEISR